MSSASAPGKVVLFGEHAVVYGRPALAVPVAQVHADVEVSESADAGVWIDAPDIDLYTELSTVPPDQPIASVIRNVFQNLGISTFPPLTIRITSTIPLASGMGSGAAVSVAIIRALSCMFDRPFPDETVSALAFEAEKFYHGTPSGIDNTVVTFARPVYFIKSNSPIGRGNRGEGPFIETFQVKKPFTIVIGDTGVPASTKESVGDVRRLWQADPPRWEKVFDAVGDIVQQARRAIEVGEVDVLGPLMDANHALLQEMTVSSPELDQLVAAARSAGALGAKLSGGGRGGNMIALVTLEKREQVEALLRAAGARRVLVTTVESCQT